MSRIDLTALQCAPGASWDLQSVCLDQTRTALREEIWMWIRSADVNKTAEIMWLTGVAGAGKSTVAHTIAQRCKDEGLLLSCFFFARREEGRDGLQMLFSTIAHDLASDANVAEQIGISIEHDRSIARASPSRQFRAFILDIAHWYPVDNPVVIIMDGLDEVCNCERLLLILRDEIPKLPGNFRFLVSSRPEPTIVSYISKKAHVHSCTMDIDGQANLEDIAVYAQFKLEELAMLQNMGSDWPGDELSKAFACRAEGLFVWVSTVCKHLSHAADPAAQLVSLISNSSPMGLTTEAKMDKTYTTILESCDWEDEAFVNGYGLFMGAIMAVKNPLSASAFQSLYYTRLTLPVRRVLRPLSSLLIGFTDEDETQPIRILHQSLRDFLTVRAANSPKSLAFFLEEKQHNERLAIICLDIMNQRLQPDIAGTGYLKSELEGIPESAGSHASEELWYACRFWIDHIVEVKAPVSDLVDAMHTFFSTKAVLLWMELVTSKGQFQKLAKARQWLQVRHQIDLLFLLWLNMIVSVSENIT